MNSALGPQRKIWGKIGFLLFCAVSIVLFYFIASHIFTAERITLDTPANLKLDGYELSWSGVQHAVGYEVVIGDEDSEDEDDDEKRTTFLPRINLKYSDNGKEVRVRAVADEKTRDSSDFSEAFVIEMDLDALPIVVYACVETGYVGREFNYDGEEVPLPHIDFSGEGYELRGWYTYSSVGERMDITEPTVFEGSVELIADVEPIVYSVEYVVDNYAGELPTSYTVESAHELFVVIEREGYIISEWYIDGNPGRLLSEETKILGDIKLYPKEEKFINDGLTLEEVGDVYSASYHGDDEVLHIPKEYGGKRISVIGEGAVSSENLKRIICYGDITIESGGIVNCPLLEEMTVMGNLTADESALRLYGTPFTLKIYGQPNLNVAFISCYLGISPQVTIYSSKQYTDELRSQFPKYTVSEIDWRKAFYRTISATDELRVQFPQYTV